MAFHLGLDVGTQSVKALLLDDERGPLAVHASPLTCIEGLPPGHSEQHPADWIDGVRAAVARLGAGHGDALRRVRSVAVSGQQHGLVALDGDDRVIRPAKLWNDTASAPQCAAIVAELGGAAELHRLTGHARLPAGFTAGKVRWLREREPDHFARLRHVLLPHDFVNLWLCGERCCEAGDASGTGWFDARGRAPVPAVMAAAAPGLNAMLPPLRAPGEPAGRIRAEVARELGLPDDVVVGHGGGDNMMAAVGAGALRPGVAVLSLGTSGTVFAHAGHPVCDPGGALAAFCDSTGGWLPLGCTQNATVTTELVRRALGLDVAAMEAAAAQAPPGADGAVCLPFFTGERTPDLPDATGSFVGLTPANMHPGHLARAAMEGATFALVALFDVLRRLDVAIDDLRLTGGGSNSPLWCRIVAAAAGVPVTLGVHADAAALGAAWNGCWTWQRLRDPACTQADVVAVCPTPPAASRTLQPDPLWVERYAAARARYDTLVQHTKVPGTIVPTTVTPA